MINRKLFLAGLLSACLMLLFIVYFLIHFHYVNLLNDTISIFIPTIIVMCIVFYSDDERALEFLRFSFLVMIVFFLIHILSVYTSNLMLIESTKQALERAKQIGDTNIDGLKNFQYSLSNKWNHFSDLKLNLSLLLTTINIGLLTIGSLLCLDEKLKISSFFRGFGLFILMLGLNETLSPTLKLTVNLFDSCFVLLFGMNSSIIVTDYFLWGLDIVDPLLLLLMLCLFLRIIIKGKLLFHD